MKEIRVSFGDENWTMHAEDDGIQILDCRHSYSIYWINDYKTFRNELESMHKLMCSDNMLHDSFKYSFDVEYVKQQHALQFLVHNLKYHGIDREQRKLVNKLFSSISKRAMVYNSGSSAEDMYTLGMSVVNYKKLKLDDAVDICIGEPYNNIIYALLPLCDRNHRIDFLIRLIEMSPSEMNWTLCKLVEQYHIIKKDNLSRNSVVNISEIMMRKSLYEGFVALSSHIPKCVRLYPFESDVLFDELPNIPTTQYQWVACNILGEFNLNMCFKKQNRIMFENNVANIELVTNNIAPMTISQAVNLPDKFIQFYSTKVEHREYPEHHDQTVNSKETNIYKRLSEQLLDVALYIHDGDKIRSDYINTTIPFNKINGSMVRRLQNAYFNHNTEVKLVIDEKVRVLSMSSESEPMALPKIKLPRSLEKCRVKYKLELITIGNALKNCAGTRTDSSNIFFRKGYVLAQVDLDTKRLIEVKDYKNTVTKASTRFGEYLRNRLGLEGHKANVYLNDIQVIHNVNLGVDLDPVDADPIDVLANRVEAIQPIIEAGMQNIERVVANDYEVGNYRFIETNYTHTNTRLTCTAHNTIYLPMMTWENIPSKHQRSYISIGGIGIFNTVRLQPDVPTAPVVTVTRNGDRIVSVGQTYNDTHINATGNIVQFQEQKFVIDDEAKYCVMVGTKKYLGSLRKCRLLIASTSDSMLIYGGTTASTVIVADNITSDMITNIANAVNANIVP